MILEEDPDGKLDDRTLDSSFVAFEVFSGTRAGEGQQDLQKLLANEVPFWAMCRRFCKAEGEKMQKLQTPHLLGYFCFFS
jgi:hypothetical protein